MIIKVHNYLTPSEISNVLKSLSYIFEKKTEEPDFMLDLSFIKKTHFLGVLVLYKVIEYSYIHKRFLEPTLATDDHGDIEKAIIKFGFWDLITDYMLDKDAVKQYKKLKVVVEQSFFLAPQALLRDESFTMRNLKEKVLPQIQDYYNNDKTSNMIFQCFSEILLNFWEHAVEDTKSVIVARGSKDYIEIACADTAKGIISTLKPILDVGLANKDILLQSVQRGITSKTNTNHMGFGLWILSEIVKLVKGRMHIYSEGFAYQNEEGNVKVFETGYWQGTVIYIALPVRNPVTVSDIMEYRDNNSFSNLKIDFK